MKGFPVYVGVPHTSFRTRIFWAVRKSLLKSEVAICEFQRNAKAADMDDARWRAEQQENRIEALIKQLDVIHNSLSWRVSAPVRWLGSLLLALPKPKKNVFAYVRSNPHAGLLDPETEL